MTFTTFLYKVITAASTGQAPELGGCRTIDPFLSFPRLLSSLPAPFPTSQSVLSSAYAPSPCSLVIPHEPAAPDARGGIRCRLQCASPTTPRQQSRGCLAH